MAAPYKPFIPSHLTFPSEKSTSSYWRSQPHALENHRSTPGLPAYSDVVVIGAGMTGVSIAYHLLTHPDDQRNTGDISNGCAGLDATSTSTSAEPLLPPEANPSITILEGRGLCSGATGRNGGHLKLAFAHVLLADGSSKTDLRTKIELGEYMLAQLEAMKALSERERLDEGEFLVTRSWDVILDRGMWEEKVARLDALRMAIEGLGEEDGGLRERGRRVLNAIQLLSAEKWGVEAIERVTGVKDVQGGALGVPAASLWPYKFVCSLAARILERVNLQTHTMVLGVEGLADAEGMYTIKTARGEMKARKIVFATNAYTAGLVYEFESLIMPVKGTAAHVVRPKAALGESNSFVTKQSRTTTYNIHHPFHETDYLNHRPDGGVVLGGAYDVFRHDTARCVATIDDSTLVHEEDVRRYFLDLMRNSYSDWNASGVEIDHLWTGIMGATPDGKPFVGEVEGRKGWYICAGFNGAGMLLILLAGRELAKMVRDGKKVEETEILNMFRVTKERMRGEFPEGRWALPGGRRLARSGVRSSK